MLLVLFFSCCPSVDSGHSSAMFYAACVSAAEPAMKAPLFNPDKYFKTGSGRASATVARHTCIRASAGLREVTDDVAFSAAAILQQQQQLQQHGRRCLCDMGPCPPKFDSGVLAIT